MLPLDRFAKNTKGVAGRSTRCKPCVYAQVKVARQADPEKYRTYTRDYYERDPGRFHDLAVCRRFGLSRGQYAELLAQQNGLCALCKKAPGSSKRLHVDHDHQTGRVRGLLCHHCNTGVGNLQDDPALLRAAAAYVESFRSAHV